MCVPRWVVGCNCLTFGVGGPSWRCDFMWTLHSSYLLHLLPPVSHTSPVMIQSHTHHSTAVTWYMYNCQSATLSFWAEAQLSGSTFNSINIAGLPAARSEISGPNFFWKISGHFCRFHDAQDTEKALFMCS